MIRQKKLSIPYLLWLAVFIVAPLLLIVYYSMVDANGHFSLSGYKMFFDMIYIRVLLRSLYTALICTVICLLVGYPAAMILTTKEWSKTTAWTLLFVIPMWMNFLLRTYAWLVLLEYNGLINQFLRFIGLSGFQMLYTDQAVILGMVYNFLPFMVFPIYSVLVKIDRHLIEAAEDLGANKYGVFWKVTFPLSLPGVISGITMVFMPAVTTFVISRLLGGGDYMLIGNLIEQQFTFAGNWNFGSALSVIMMLFILAGMAFFYKDNTRNGSGLL